MSSEARAHEIRAGAKIVPRPLPGGTVDSVNPSADLSGPLARVQWAEHGVRDLNESARQYALIFDRDPKAGEALLLRAALQASNIVHQLRAALDNLVWDLVILNEQEPTRANAFPIRTVNNSDSRRDVAKRLAGVDAQHVDVIESLQPWHPWQGEDDLDIHPLEQLEELWNVDKHRVLLRPGGEPEALPTVFGDIPGVGLAYEGKTRLVPLLRRAAGFVDAIVHGFRPALSGQPVTITLTPDTAKLCAEALRLRDPSSTYLDDIHRVTGWVASPSDLDNAPDADLQLLLGAAQRILASPVREHYEETLTLLERELTERLALRHGSATRYGRNT